MITLYELYKMTDAPVYIRDPVCYCEYNGETIGAKYEVLSVKPIIRAGGNYMLEVTVKVHDEEIVQFTADEVEEMIETTHDYESSVLMDEETYIKSHLNSKYKGEIVQAIHRTQCGVDLLRSSLMNTLEDERIQKEVRK